MLSVSYLRPLKTEDQSLSRAIALDSTTDIVAIVTTKKNNKYLIGRCKASLKPCMSAVLTGTLAGGLTGLIGRDLLDTPVFDSTTAAPASLLGAQLLSDEDDRFKPSLIAAGLYSSLSGGIVSAVVTDAGVLGAGIGFCAGLLFPMLLAQTDDL